MLAKSLQSCLTLWCLPDSSVHGILQTRILEWASMSSSRGSSKPRNWTLSFTSPALVEGFFITEPPGKPVTTLLLLLLLSRFSRVQLCVTPQTAAHQAPLSLGFSRQEYWSGLPFPSPGDLPDSGIKPASLALQSDSLPLSHQGSQMPSRYHKHKGKSVQWGF